MGPRGELENVSRAESDTRLFFRVKIKFVAADRNRSFLAALPRACVNVKWMSLSESTVVPARWKTKGKLRVCEFNVESELEGREDLSFVAGEQIRDARFWGQMEGALKWRDSPTDNFTRDVEEEEDNIIKVYEELHFHGWCHSRHCNWD